MIRLRLAALLLPGLACAAAPSPVPTPGEIVAAAPTSDWVAIAPSDLLVMDLSGDRRVVIQLMPPPFSQGWIGNIRRLAAAHWWDGTSINRVQDNYVVQWGDANAEDKARAKALPSGIMTVSARDYTIESPVSSGQSDVDYATDMAMRQTMGSDSYASGTRWLAGFPVAYPNLSSKDRRWWPVHCYGMVGVGRDLPPDTGTGAELYTVIGTPPRHLDRNIALVGRVVAGIEHLSSLPRGTGPLGFYEKLEQRVPIVRIRLATDLPEAERPRFEYLSTESATFTRYADARANRRDAFFVTPAGGVDICNVPVPVRAAK